MYIYIYVYISSYHIYIKVVSMLQIYNILCIDFKKDLMGKFPRVYSTLAFANTNYLFHMS